MSLPLPLPILAAAGAAAGWLVGRRSASAEAAAAAASAASPGAPAASTPTDATGGGASSATLQWGDQGSGAGVLNGVMPGSVGANPVGDGGGYGSGGGYGAPPAGSPAPAGTLSGMDAPATPTGYVAPAPAPAPAPPAGSTLSFPGGKLYRLPMLATGVLTVGYNNAPAFTATWISVYFPGNAWNPWWRATSGPYSGYFAPRGVLG